MRQVGTFPREARTFGCDRYPIGQAHRIPLISRCDFTGRGLQPILNLQNGPQEGSRITSVKYDGVKTVQAKVVDKPLHTALLRHGCPLIDTATVGDHDWGYQAGILSPPPTRSPV